MTRNSIKTLLRGKLAALAVFGALAMSGSASAAKLGPYFPIPNGFNLNGVQRDALLAIQNKWLEGGLDNLKKARAKETAEDKQKELDEMIANTEKELALSKEINPDHNIQVDRKNGLMLNINQWINELNHLATEQMKIAIMSDGAEAMAAQNRNAQLSEQADNLEKAKHDASMENWK